MKLLSFQTGSRSVLAVSFADLVRTFGRSSAVLMLPIYFLQVRGVSFIDIGIVLAAGSLISSPVSIAGGSIADRIGRRPLFILLPLLSFILFGAISAEIFMNAPILLLFVTLVLTQPVGNLQRIVDSAVVSDVTMVHERSHAFSVMRLASNLGFSLGPVVGGVVSIAGFGYAFMIPAAANLAEEVVYVRYLLESRPPSGTEPSQRRRIRIPSDDRLFILVALVLTFSEFAIGQWGSTLTLFLSHSYSYSTAEIGIIYSLNGIVVVTLQLPTNRALSRFSDISRLMIGMLLYSATFLVFGLTDVLALLLVNVVFLTMGENIFSPTSTAYISKIAPADRRGEYFGAFSAMNMFASPFASLLGAVLLTRFSTSAAVIWLIVSLLCILSVVMLKAAGSRAEASGRIAEPATVGLD